MKISAHEEYGLRCLLEIGRHGAGKSLTIPEISAAEDISASYVAKLLRILRRAGFLKSARGKSGGYSLSRPAAQIAIGDVMAALGERVFPSDFCQRHPGKGNLCVHSTDCSLRPLWRTIQDAVDQVLSRTTLQDILSDEREVNTWIDRSRLSSAQPLEARSSNALTS
jgi:Rrf2 family transcriptional regulator, iron-sulfur cluster assembly transcription factor